MRIVPHKSSLLNCEFQPVLLRSLSIRMSATEARLSPLGRLIRGLSIRIQRPAEINRLPDPGLVMGVGIPNCLLPRKTSKTCRTLTS